jgi:hypothetical protein
MPRRPKPPRPEPCTEGSLAEIYRWFFGKLNFLKPEMFTLKDWEEHLFDIKNRDITRFSVKKPFKLPGLYYMAGALKIQGLGYRQMKTGDILWVRTDERTKKADVEVLAGQGQKDQVFELNESEWGWVRLHLEEAERKKKA